MTYRALEMQHTYIHTTETTVQRNIRNTSRNSKKPHTITQTKQNHKPTRSTHKQRQTNSLKKNLTHACTTQNLSCAFPHLRKGELITFSQSYVHKIDPQNHPSPLCPLCNTQNHDTKHLFTQILQLPWFSAFLFISPYASSNTLSIMPILGLPLGLFPSIIPSSTTFIRPSPRTTCPIQFFFLSHIVFISEN